MTREEFVRWFDSTTSFSKEFETDDTSWRNMVDYADYRFDYVYINESNVDYSWEELYWGGSETREKTFTFENFIENYKNDTIKN